MISAHDMHTGLLLLGWAWNQIGPLIADGSPGTIKVEFITSGIYQISLMRYPPESGLAFNAKVPAESKSLENEWPLPASRDVDIHGRIWVTEAVNYRDFNNDEGFLEHPKGDRVMILEDTDGDGMADSSKVFVQDDYCIYR